MSDAGLRLGLTYDEYASIPAVNISLLRHFARSPAHARHEMLAPAESTAAQVLGQAIHASILEPDAFPLRYAAGPVGLDRRTSAGKAAWGGFLADLGARLAITAEEYERCQAASTAVWGQTTAAGLLGGVGRNEVSAVWTDAETGLACKGRLDRLTSWLGWSWVVDLKSCRDASPGSFRRDVARYGYQDQAAYYLDGLNILAPRARRFVWVAVEQEAPHGAAVYELDDAGLELGRRSYRRALTRYAECLASGLWPSYPDGIIPLTLPRWVGYEEGEEST